MVSQPEAAESPRPQSAPSTRTAAGDLTPEIPPRLELQEDSKQKEDPPGEGESRDFKLPKDCKLPPNANAGGKSAEGLNA